MISIYEIAALTTAFLWACGSMIAAYSVKQMGSFAFNKYRLTIAFMILILINLAIGQWRYYPTEFIPMVLVSGFVGIFMGDAVLFAGIRRLGARRSSVIFAMNAPFTAILGYFFLNEKLNILEIAGITVAIIGVILAIVFGKRKSTLSKWEDVISPLWVGVVLCLLGALGQSVGSIVIRPVMDSGVDPFPTAALRVGIAALAFLAISAALPKATKPENPVTPRILMLVVATATIGMVVGMTLILFAFSGTSSTGIIATLSATTPVMVLPMVWIMSKEAPALGAWIGAALVVVGSSLIFMA